MAETAQSSKYEGHIDIEVRKGNQRNFLETELFMPLRQTNNQFLFLDVRGFQDNKNSREGNIGLGYRHIPDSTFMGHKWIVGSYAFFDLRKSPTNHNFIQGTFGLEALSEDWDFRANLYVPEKSEKEISGTSDVTAVLDNNQLRIIGIDNTRERALSGTDAEIGYKLPLLQNSIDSMRLYAGGYHFDASGFDNITGTRGRMELSWDDLPYIGEGSRLTLGGEIQHDNARDTTAYALARLRIPLQTQKNVTATFPRLNTA